ncbi:MAG: GIY-YIG nuclease family protein [Bacteroidetes bacterium]|nr:GIY-YIG nuclease family protein [Bacteroidota bacterium]
MNLKEEINKFLKNQRYLPLSLWNNFEVNHGNKKDEKQMFSLIKDTVKLKSGLYLYKKDKRILYIGKAKSLKDRIKSHYRESYKEVPGDRKDKGFHLFFSAKKNCGPVEIYWIEVASEDERIIFEAMLQYILNPEFCQRGKHC